MTTQPRTVPYGSWASPVTSGSLSSDRVVLDQPLVSAGRCLWLEGRPSEGGRVVLVADGRDVTPPPFNVRSRVHEYGGGAYTVDGDTVLFVDFADQRVHRVDLSGSAQPVAITPPSDATVRYGDLRVDRDRGTVWCVREDHRRGGEPVNEIVRLELDGPNEDFGTVAVTGPDFVMAPRLSPDGRTLAWVQWDHPSMPWDSTQLWTADVGAGGVLTEAVLVAGGDGVAVTEPRWAPDGRLVFLSDETGWANPYAVPPGGGNPSPLLRVERELGWPQWVLDRPSYAVAADGSLVVTWFEDGFGRLGRTTADGRLEPLDVEGTAFDHVRAEGATVVALTHRADRPRAVLRVDLGSGAVEVVAEESQVSLPQGLVSRPEAVSWTNGAGEQVHGILYPPANAGVAAPAGTLPPLLVRTHGGPTSMTAPAFGLDTVFWTSRGIAVLDVNYGGSTGYGRAYRERLRGSWGLVDVDDCASGALAMAEQGRVDGTKLGIRGGSAGGFTTLAALTNTEVFAAGASHFGVSDLEALARDTHKFESRYLDSLVAPYPEGRDTYVERSPIHHVDSLSAPMILFQGLEDRVVPPSQAREMASAIRAKGLPVALLEFEGEGHGFRAAATVTTVHDAESWFYAKVFGYEPADHFEVAPVVVENL